MGMLFGGEEIFNFIDGMWAVAIVIKEKSYSF